VPAGEGWTYWGAGDVYTLKASRDTTNGSLGFVEATVPPAWRPERVASPELARFWDEAGIEFLPE
jgi:hypothetical protein